MEEYRDIMIDIYINNNQEYLDEQLWDDPDYQTAQHDLGHFLTTFDQPETVIADKQYEYCLTHFDVVASYHMLMLKTLSNIVDKNQ